MERYSALCTELAGDLDMPGQKAAAHHLADLVGICSAAVPSRRTHRAHGVAAARLDLMKADVPEESRQDELTIEAIARANGLSARQAQRLFASAGPRSRNLSSSSACCWHAGCCFTRRRAGRKVSDIAYTVGFNDLSYFHRAFRRKFGARQRRCRWNWGADIERARR